MLHLSMMKKKADKLYEIAKEIVALFEEHGFLIVDPDAAYYEDSYSSDVPDEVFMADELLEKLKEAVEEYE